LLFTHYSVGKVLCQVSLAFGCPFRQNSPAYRRAAPRTGIANQYSRLSQIRLSSRFFSRFMIDYDEP
jgi:hypothetical protein